MTPPSAIFVHREQTSCRWRLACSSTARTCPSPLLGLEAFGSECLIPNLAHKFRKDGVPAMNPVVIRRNAESRHPGCLPATQLDERAKVAAGSWHGMVLTARGEVYAWGHNASGQVCSVVRLCVIGGARPCRGSGCSWWDFVRRLHEPDRRWWDWNARG